MRLSGGFRLFSDGYGGFGRFRAVFWTASEVFGGFRNGFGGFRELRAFRTAWGIIVHRLELRARCPQARWRLNRRALFALSLLPANCAIPAQIPARLPRLQRYSPNGDVLLRTADLFPNCGVHSRAAWFSFSCGNSSRMAVSLRDCRVRAGLLGALDRGCGGGDGWHLGGVECRWQTWLSAGAAGFTVGATTVSKTDLRLARGGGELG